MAAITCGAFGLRKRRRNPNVKGAVHAAIAMALGAFTLLYHLAAFVALSRIK